MKTLNQHIAEKLIINQRFDEKLIINKDYRDNTIVVKSFVELRKIINDRYDKLGPGTEHNPIDFNDIDVSNLDSFCKNKVGIFERTKFEYIDISEWDVSNVTDMNHMFFICEKLKSVGDISKWNVSNVMSMRSMFSDCSKLKSFGDISSWDVSNVTDMGFMFKYCESFNQDISSWDVSNVTNMEFMFFGCVIKDEYKPKFK